MVNILVFGMMENPGGVESFIINYFRKIDHTKIHFDFLCNENGVIAYQDEIIGAGSGLFRITARSRDYMAYKRDMKRFFREHARDYDAIWVNLCSLANIDYLTAAKKYGIPRRIVHSHNSSNMDGLLRGTLHKLNKKRIAHYATDFWACSDDAARWFYDNSIRKRAVIIRNAIDVERFAFSEADRVEIRSRLECGDDCCLVGNVGRLHFQKNQMFALDVFSKFHEMNPNSKFVLIGQGEDEEKLKARARELGIDQHVIFAGVQRNVSKWLSAMDLFLFPSVFEGLGIAALEAQANGLPVLASSNVIPAEVGMSNHYMTCELNKGSEKWANVMDAIWLSMKRTNGETMRRIFREKGYDINEEAGKVEKLLMG